MAEELRSDEPTPPAAAEAHRRYNKIMLVGAPDWVSGMIARLHSAEIAHVRDWSRLVPTQHPGEVISILQRLRRSGD
ncbi:MAG: hypothetical protein OHK0037_28200 [Elainellaceae cyanobacterium]